MMHVLYDHVVTERARVRNLVGTLEKYAGDPVSIEKMRAALDRASWSLDTMDVRDQMHSLSELKSF